MKRLGVKELVRKDYGTGGNREGVAAAHGQCSGEWMVRLERQDSAFRLRTDFDERNGCGVLLFEETGASFDNQFREDFARCGGGKKVGGAAKADPLLRPAVITRFRV